MRVFFDSWPLADSGRRDYTDQYCQRLHQTYLIAHYPVPTMPHDFRKLEEEILALNPEQQARLLRKLITAMGTTPESTAGQTGVAEGQPRYETHALQKQGEGMYQLERITQQPGMMGGKACVRGMRVTVSMIVGQIGAGASIEDLLTEYPYLEREDIMQALRYAAWRAEEREVILTSA